MGNSSGFVYVMINASYTGLVKIGKTTKDPDERAKELSSATGVATPFIVVYKRQFNNCHVAEKVIHNILEEQGYRVNYSREFFSIGVTEAINLLMSIPDDNVQNDDNIDFDESPTETNLAESYFDIATNYYLGINDTFEDEDLALEYFEKSASLGKTEAYTKIGIIWKNKGNIRQALNYFRKGADNGEFICFAKLGAIYNDNESNFYNKRNAELAYKKFFEFINNSSGIQMDIDFAWNHTEIGQEVDYCLFKGILNDDISSEQEDFFVKYIFQIKAYFEHNLNSFLDINPKTAHFYESKMRPYIDKLVEKHETYGLDGDELAKYYFLLAKECFKSVENFDNSSNYLEEEQKAFELFYKSSELGHQISNIYIGICWLYKGYDYSINKADKAWKIFYNHAYKTFTEQQSTISEEQKEEFLEGFTLIIYYAIKFNAEQLIHEYYVLLALYLGIIDYYSKRIDLLASKECYKLDDNFEFKSFDMDNLDINNQSELANLLDQYKIVLDYIESEKERKLIEAVHSYVKNFASKKKDKFGSQTKFMIYPLDI